MRYHPEMALQFSEISRQLESWFARPRGQYLLEQERLLVNSVLGEAFGYHQLQLGVSGGHHIAPGSPVGHKIYCSPAAGEDVGLLSEPDCLPFADDSIDVVLLHHALEFSESPHRLLREAHRVLMPQGHIVIVGFNPLSAFGASMRVSGWLPGRFWGHSHSISSRRLKDWLHLLGAEVQGVNHCFVMPPAGGPSIFNFLARCDAAAMQYRLPLGGVYVMHARKTVSMLTPTRIRWRRPVGARLIGLSVPKPVASPRDGDVAA
jgi:SAM-dependent methyltransferase